ncbi:MAG TPA: sulfotransferase [Clostridiales bacterium]|nr:sulfotransferase [Clostridiales bacterium]
MSSNRYLKGLSTHFLLGCSLINWFRLLWSNRRQPLSLHGFPKFLFVTAIILLLTPFRLADRLISSIRLKRVVFKQDPVFVLGHWRSGTTYLVNILSCDPQFGVTNAVHCFAPHLFLGAYRLCDWILRRVLPKKRPMDNIEIDTISSQEEEFAMANITPCSFYHMTVFQRNWRTYSHYMDLTDIPEKDISEWKQRYHYLLKKVTCQLKGKQLLLKSPVNTCRIRYLLELFPNAKFVHIYRNPYQVFASTRKLYKRLFPLFGIQSAVEDEAASEEVQMKLYENMYNKFFAEKNLIPENRLVEIRYEDLVSDPSGVVQFIYTQLNLPGYPEIQSKLDSYIKSKKNYQSNQYVMDPETMIKLSARFRFLLDKWGYKI